MRLSKVSYNFPSRHAANDFNLYYYFYTNVQPYLLAVYGSSRPRAVLKYVSLLKLFYTVRIRIARGGEYFAACYALKKGDCANDIADRRGLSSFTGMVLRLI